MSSEWKKHQYELMQTDDGSPSLVVTFSGGGAECMHHRGGAWSETKMIYEQPAKLIMQAGGQKFLSVGLGLAYNEMMLMALSQKIQTPIKLLQSYEANTFLIESFQKFLQGEYLPEEIQDTYQQILQLIAEGQDSLQLKTNMQENLLQQSLKLSGSLNPQTLPQEKFDYVLFDAFSNKSTPELWTEDFLTKFFLGLGEDCVLSTYACTGALKRALKKTGFQLLPRLGFAGRRESTLAVKGQKYLIPMQQLIQSKST